MHAGDKSGRLFRTLFIAVPLCIGIFFLARGLMLHQSPWLTANWQQTDGTIVGVQVVYRGPMILPELSGKRSSFDAHISYEYTVDGHMYPGNDGTFVLKRRDTEVIDRTEAERRAQSSFPIGGHMIVAYAPANRSQSTIQPGTRSPAVGDFVVGFASILVIVWVGWNMRKKRGGSSVL